MHPHNRRERELIGRIKGMKRVQQEINHNIVIRNKFESLEKQKEMASHRKDTTKLCSCAMCGNPRKYFGQATKQEIQDKDFVEYELEEIWKT